MKLRELLLFAWGATALNAVAPILFAGSPAIVFLAQEGVRAAVPFAVSADGTTVVGRYEFITEDGVRGPTYAFRWTAATGFESVGTVLGGTSSSASAVTADGLVVAGHGNTAFGHRAGFRKAGGGPMVPVYDLDSTNDTPTAEVTAMSADGRILSGFHRDNNNDVRSFVWELSGDGPGGTFQTLGMLFDGTSRSSGRHFNRVAAVSDDGRYLAGWSDAGTNASNQIQAFRFDRESNTVEALGFLPGSASPRSEAVAMSADGTAIAGVSRSTLPNNASEFFYWRADAGMTGLGVPFTSGQVLQMGISGNGRYVVSSTGGRAFRWDAGTGEFLFLDTVLAELAGWHVTVATAISYDGSVITGFGTRENTGSGSEAAWVVTLPVPERQLPDRLPRLQISGTAPNGLIHLQMEWQNRAFSTPYILEHSTDMVQWDPLFIWQSNGAGGSPDVSFSQPGLILQSVNFESEWAVTQLSFPMNQPRHFFRVIWQ